MREALTLVIKKSIVRVEVCFSCKNIENNMYLVQSMTFVNENRIKLSEFINTIKHYTVLY